MIRFYGRISDVADKHDESTIEDIKANITGLQIISGQRIWVELKKILQGNFRIELFIKLLECGAMPYIGNKPLKQKCSVTVKSPS